MTKSVIDNAIFLQAMTGEDVEDPVSVSANEDYLEGLEKASLQGRRIGVFRSLMSDSLYSQAVAQMQRLGAEIVEFEAPEIRLEGFSTLLDADMKRDLPAYIADAAGKNLPIRTAGDVIAYNEEDSVIRAPYGQQLFRNVEADSTSDEELADLRQDLQDKGRKFFEIPLTAHDLDAVLSINNYHAAYAAVAKYPAFTLPVGFEEAGEPKNITFIARPFEEKKLLDLGYAFEKDFRARKAPELYNR